ncbi:MAG: alpha/beta hydrolase family protein [Bryobacteraceae bacterium]
MRLLSLALVVPALLRADTLLEWMDKVAQQQLAKREAEVAKVRTVAGAQTRQKWARAKILELIGGLPDYDGPLNARVTGTIELSRYRIEKVIFESLPKMYITGNVYLPKEPGRYPGVLMPMGHWMEGKAAGQQISANLAMKGFVVLAFDPLGQGERLQAYDKRMRASLAAGSTDQHNLTGAQSVLAGEAFARYRIWDAKRALDYLVSRRDVDGDRIGCTGCSGGGTVTTYISALDPRIKVSAPACYMNTFRLLFSGPTGDAEQSVQGFISSGLDLADYVEMFAPKPYLIVSTSGDFFPIDGARAVYEEARRWYRVYGAEDKIAWAVGPGGHGTPREVRERIYDWMIRWLGGKGDSRDEPIEALPAHKLYATEGGQVDGREAYEVIADGFRRRMSTGAVEDMLAELRKWTPLGERRAPATRVLEETPAAEYRIQKIAVETEPGLEIQGTLAAPAGAGRKPAVLLVNGNAAQTARLAKAGNVVLSIAPRSGPPRQNSNAPRIAGDSVTNIRAWLIGKNLAAMRAADVVRGVDLLAARADVDASRIRGAARDVAGVWLLMAASLDPRIGRVWLDKTPHSLRAAMDMPVHRNLHDAAIPGFALKWDLEDMRKAVAPREVIWSDPTDWMGAVAPNLDGFLYRSFEEPDDRFVEKLLR